MSKQAQYTVRQIPGEMFADKDSSYGPEVEALCAQLWVKACLKLVRMLLNALGGVLLLKHLLKQDTC